MRRFLPVIALAAVLLTAAPAWAHEEINPSTIPTGKPVFFGLNAANEKTVDLTKMTLTAPTGVDFGESTKSPAGWTADRTEEAITWTGGKVAPEQFDQWGFEIEGADQPGSLTYKVTLGFADGSSDDVDVVITVTDSVSGSGGTSVSEKSGNDGAGLAIALSVLAVVLSVVAVAVGARRKPGGSAGSASPPAAAKDW